MPFVRLYKEKASFGIWSWNKVKSFKGTMAAHSFTSTLLQRHISHFWTTFFSSKDSNCDAFSVVHVSKWAGGSDLHQHHEDILICFRNRTRCTRRTWTRRAASLLEASGVLCHPFLWLSFDSSSACFRNSDLQETPSCRCFIVMTILFHWCDWKVVFCWLFFEALILNSLLLGFSEETLPVVFKLESGSQQMCAEDAKALQRLETPNLCSVRWQC